jgi:cobalt-zinc-cadmium efflux system protein
MTHSHHDRHHAPHCRSRNKRRLALTLALSGGYMLVEGVGGLLTHSLALLADAGHMLSDVAALGLSLFAVWIAERPPTAKRTYGYYRTEILAALVNGSALIAVAVSILVEAYRRLMEPQYVQGAAMMAIAAGGLGVNLLGLWILRAGRETNLNVRGAWLHVLTDALGSVAAIVAGVLIWAAGWYWADPVASALIATLVVYSAWRLVLEAVVVLMESAPRGIDVDEVYNAMNEMPGVLGVHDLHVWTITSGMDSLSAHVAVEENQPPIELLGTLRTMLHDRFGIDHITIQIEPEDFEERPTAF